VGAVAKYCNEYVCVSVCVRLSVCLFVSIYPEPQVRSLPFFVRVANRRGSVLLRQGDEIQRGMGSFGGFLSHHCQCIVMRLLQMGSAGKGVMGVHRAGAV